MNVFTVRSRIFICASPGYGSEERAFLSNHSLVWINLKFYQSGLKSMKKLLIRVLV